MRNTILLVETYAAGMRRHACAHTKASLELTICMKPETPYVLDENAARHANGRVVEGKRNSVSVCLSLSLYLSLSLLL